MMMMISVPSPMYMAPPSSSSLRVPFRRVGQTHGHRYDLRPMCRRLSAVAVTTVVLVACGSTTTRGAAPTTRRSVATAPTTTVPPVYVVATAKVPAVGVWDSPGVGQPGRTLPNPQLPYKTPLVFLVQEQQPDWIHVYLPVRPNGSTGWVRDSAVTLALDPYRVEISLGKHLVTVWEGTVGILQVQAGVGRSVLPTPLGTYYITELLKQPDPSGPYGPYAFGLSAFSDVLFHFGGSDGEIGLHGTDNPAGLGTDVSHGCIRLSNAAIAKLAGLLPLGTPVLITR